MKRKVILTKTGRTITGIIFILFIISSFIIMTCGQDWNIVAQVILASIWILSFSWTYYWLG